MSYIQKIFGANVKKYRIKHELTMENLAEKIDINYQNLSKIENGKGFVTADTFEKICDALGVKPEQLLSLNDVLPEKVTIDEIKPLLHQIVNSLDEKQSKALYKVVLGFIEATNI